MINEQVARGPQRILAGFNLLPDEELIENVCDNEKDLPHMVGK